MAPSEKYQRARESWKEAWQMALDLNQPADVRREWEAKREVAFSEMERLAWGELRFSGLTCPWRCVTIN
jgi:hypothetical protein